MGRFCRKRDVTMEDSSSLGRDTNESKSHRSCGNCEKVCHLIFCNCNKLEDCNVIFQICKNCKSVYNCSKENQKSTWPFHKPLLNTITQLQEQEKERITKLSNFFLQNQVKTNLIADRCIVICKLNNFVIKILINNGEQVSLLSKGWLENNHPDPMIKEVYNLFEESDQLRVR